MTSAMKRTPVFAALLVALSVTYGCGSDSDNTINVVDADEGGAQPVVTDSPVNTTGNTSTDEGDSDGVAAESPSEDTGIVVNDDTGTDSEATGGESEIDNGEPETPATDPAPAAEFEAAYTARFVAIWSEETHPTNFPPDPHFSPLTGAVHNEQVVIWQPGQNASDGIEEMAETGSTGLMLTEIQFAIDQGYASSSIEGGGIPLSPGATDVGFVVNRDNPLVTLVSMLAPSPDWFVGVNSLRMIDENGDFLDSVTIALNLYDSGTDGGERFTDPDQDIPRSPIALVSSFPPDTDFFDGQPPVGTLTLTREP